jgi:acetolactate synthase-1/2/3 large subunit
VKRAEGPIVIDCQINCDDKVYPMVSPGDAIHKAFDETDLKIKQQ